MASNYTPPQCPLGGEVVHVPSLPMVNSLLLSFYWQSWTICLWTFYERRHDILKKPSENNLSSVKAWCDIHEMQNVLLFLRPLLILVYLEGQYCNSGFVITIGPFASFKFVHLERPLKWMSAPQCHLVSLLLWE